MTGPCVRRPEDRWSSAMRAWLAARLPEPAYHPVSDGPAHPEVLVPQRLEAAGIDIDYETLVAPALVAELKRVCSSCTHVENCTHDFGFADANERLAEYCPNTPAIDDLMIERAIGKTV